MTGDAIPDLEHQIAVLIRRHRATPARSRRDPHPGLTGAAYGLLIRLDRHGPHRPTDLAEYAGVGLSTVIRQLQPLEAAGLVERRPAAGDSRAHVVALTDHGRHWVGEARAVRDRRLRDQLSAWGEEDIRTLAELLERFNRSAPGPGD